MSLKAKRTIFICNPSWTLYLSKTHSKISGIMAENEIAVLSLEKLIFQGSSSGRTDDYALVKTISSHTEQSKWNSFPLSCLAMWTLKVIKFLSKFESAKDQIMVFWLQQFSSAKFSLKSKSWYCFTKQYT